MPTIDDRAAAWSERRELYVLTTPTLMEASYHQGATEQKQIDDERLEYIVSKWKQEETLWRERYNAIHQALIERQGEYISIELIEEVFVSLLKPKDSH